MRHAPRPFTGYAVSRFALWDLGLRPFYLFASAFASLSIALWAGQYAGWLPDPYLRGPVWHGHEMLFGYTMAVIAGFLFTAVRNWTGRPTPRGALLAGFVALWLAGRLLVLTPFAFAAAVVNAAFPLAVAAAIAVPLAAAGNRRNYFFIALLAGCSVAALCVHLAILGVVEWPARASLVAGLDIVLLIVAVIAGRVIPMFTNNAIAAAGATREPFVERVALGSVVALLAVDVAGLEFTAAGIAAAGALAHAWRLALWRPWKTLHTPLVWVLHASYAWIPIHLAMRTLAVLDLAPITLATHALTIGVIGGMTMGMMTRTARGHTGRTLAVGRSEVACYALVQAAAIVRVFGGWLFPGAYLVTVLVSAACWSAGFAIYAVRYAPMLAKE